MRRRHLLQLQEVKLQQIRRKHLYPNKVLILLELWENKRKHLQWNTGQWIQVFACMYLHTVYTSYSAFHHTEFSTSEFPVIHWECVVANYVLFFDHAGLNLYSRFHLLATCMHMISQYIKLCYIARSACFNDIKYSLHNFWGMQLIFAGFTVNWYSMKCWNFINKTCKIYRRVGYMWTAIFDTCK